MGTISETMLISKELGEKVGCKSAKVQRCFSPVARNSSSSSTASSKWAGAKLFWIQTQNSLIWRDFRFAKPKLFFKNIGCYRATSTYIHIRVPFNLMQLFDTKNSLLQPTTNYWKTMRSCSNPLKALQLMSAGCPLQPVWKTSVTSSKLFNNQQSFQCQGNQNDLL